MVIRGLWFDYFIMSFIEVVVEDEVFRMGKEKR